MKDKWLKDIKNQMKNYESIPPENLWESIEEKMAEKKKKRKGIFFLLWTKRIASVAAMIGFVLTLNHFLHREESLPAFSATNAPEIIKNNSVPISPSIHKDIENIDINPKKTTSNNSTPNVASQIVAIENSDKNLLKIIPARTNEKLRINQIKIEIPLNITQGNATNNPIALQEDLPLTEITETPQKNNQKRFSFGIFSSEGANSSSNSKAENNISIVSVRNDDTDWMDSPLLGVLVSNNGKESNTKVKHRFPFRTGILFSYNVYKHFNIESGLTYSRLVSDIKEGDNHHYFANEQKLHYIGIPLSLKYQIFTWKDIELYSSIGILCEKNISGEIKKTYFFDGEISKTHSESLKIKPLQWSANASTGIQYNLYPFLGFYIEPSLSYYFDNKAPVHTIYNDNPLNFYLNFGIRFSVK